jgi:tetratricopeptide (TPR) repeat protein
MFLEIPHMTIRNSIRKGLGTALMLACMGLLPVALRAEVAEEAPKGIDAAWDYYRGGEYTLAVKAFTKVLEGEVKTSPLYQAALFGLATTWNLRRPGEDVPKAVELYNELIQASPKSDLAAWSSLALARLVHLVPVGEEPDYAKVRAAYQDVINRYPDHLAGEEAFLYQQSTFVATLKPEDARTAIPVLLNHIQTHPKSKFTSVLYGLVAQCYYTLNEPQKRYQYDMLSLANREIDPGPNSMVDTGSYWWTASEAEFEVGDFATARKYYTKFIQDNPTDIRIYSAKQALKRMDKVEADLRAGRKVGAVVGAQKGKP